MGLGESYLAGKRQHEDTSLDLALFTAATALLPFSRCLTPL